MAQMLNQTLPQFEQDKSAVLQMIRTTISDWIKEWEDKGKEIPPAQPRGEPQTLGDYLDMMELEKRDKIAVL